MTGNQEINQNEASLCIIPALSIIIETFTIYQLFHISSKFDLFIGVVDSKAH